MCEWAVWMLMEINVCPFRATVKVKVASEFTWPTELYYSRDNRGDTKPLLLLLLRKHNNESTKLFAVCPTGSRLRCLLYLQFLHVSNSSVPESDWSWSCLPGVIAAVVICRTLDLPPRLPGFSCCRGLLDGRGRTHTGGASLSVHVCAAITGLSAPGTHLLKRLFFFS